jgi:hypothetical protein
MLEHPGQTSPAANAAAQSSAAPSTSRVRPSSFKYYIHDSIGVLRLKLIGELRQADIAELNGCWRTAKTTLGKRKLVLDLESLRTVDEAGKQWLASMSAEGACYLPENYLMTCIAGQHAAEAEAAPVPAKHGLWKKLAGLLRGDARSARQAQ